MPSAQFGTLKNTCGVERMFLRMFAPMSSNVHAKRANSPKKINDFVLEFKRILLKLFVSNYDYLLYLKKHY